MSWSASFVKPVPKREAWAAIDLLGFNLTEVDSIANLEAIDQLQAAKDVAKLLLKSIPGPNIMVSLGGHANGVGWQEKPGHSNNCISVSIVQSKPQ